MARIEEVGGGRMVETPFDKIISLLALLEMLRAGIG